MPLTFNGKSPVIPEGSLILVTGANGFIGSHVCDQILQAGYRVRGTSREVSKTKWMEDIFEKKYGSGRFESAVVEDMAREDAFDGVCKGIHGVCHVASIMTYDRDPNKVIPQTITGALNAAKSAAKSPSVARFVYTSSSTAITSPQPNVPFPIGVTDWNDADVASAWDPPPGHENDPTRGQTVYAASKTSAEKAIWDFTRTSQPPPQFVLNTVLPNANFGELLHTKQPASTGDWVRKCFLNDIDSIKFIDPQWMVDVKDTARLHVSALLDPDVQNERILAFAHPYNWNDILAALRRLFPDRRFPEDIPDLPRDLSTLDKTRSEDLLRRLGKDGYTSLEDSVRESVLDLVKE